MENIYLLMIIALAVLAAVDLVVGVSNDAVNFLNSALGSKAISFRTIMIVASLGIIFRLLKTKSKALSLKISYCFERIFKSKFIGY